MELATQTGNHVVPPLFWIALTQHPGPGDRQGLVGGRCQRVGHLHNCGLDGCVFGLSLRKVTYSHSSHSGEVLRSFCVGHGPWS